LPNGFGRQYGRLLTERLHICAEIADYPKATIEAVFPDKRSLRVIPRVAFRGSGNTGL
jgi:hypothetical protein